MKLIIIIVPKEDSKKLEETLVENKYQLTRFEGLGGYLKKKNFTFFIGVNNEKVEDVLKLIEKTCKKRKEVVTTSDLGEGLGETLITSGAKVQSGGATVFIIEVNKFFKF